MKQSQPLRQDLRIVADYIEPGTKILDIGCSDGALLTYLKHTKKVDGRGIELSQKHVTSCIKKGLTVIQGNADTDLVHYPDNSFDYVISTQMIQATHHPKEVLQEILRIGKHAIVSIPNFGHWHTRLYLLLKGRMPVTKSLAYQWYETPNIHFSTVKDFEILCNELHASITKASYLYPNGHLLSSLTASLYGNWLADKAVYKLTTDTP